MATPVPANCTCAPTDSGSSGLPHWAVEIFGYAGGALLAFALIPQIYRTFRLRSARDMSYIWQAIYSAGLTLTLVYLIMKKALAAWVFVVAELFFSFVFIGMKVYFEQFARRGKHTSFALIYSCFGGVKFERSARDALGELVDVTKEVLTDMSFQPTHQVIKAMGDNEDEPVSLRGVVQAYIYMNDFMIELRYTETAEQLLVQITSHREMNNMFDVSDRVDRRLSSKLSGAFLLNHGYAE